MEPTNATGKKYFSNWKIRHLGDVAIGQVHVHLIPYTLSRTFLQDTCVEIEEIIEVEVFMLAENLPMSKTKIKLLKIETKENESGSFALFHHDVVAVKNLPAEIKPH